MTPFSALQKHVNALTLFASGILGALGALFLAYWFLLLPRLLRLPENFSYTAQVESIDNFYDHATQSFRGEQQSVTQFSYVTISADSRSSVIENLFDVRTLKGEKIFEIGRAHV